ncbi:unnamed protein product [Acanthoscelides obtectus]|uniref:Uncharacterized protein n=1 Tax=Acanthoscelides obtectus TaxID=200917 RepID=A0A9P0NY09_ACAOB|nr:unnamed protein product [Acanthoscelides obtectus]CAK1667273.1 hypothetical protein AOBTE_LOCUS25752 [Acanthoscelides obtectus]
MIFFLSLSIFNLTITTCNKFNTYQNRFYKSQGLLQIKEKSVPSFSPYYRSSDTIIMETFLVIKKKYDAVRPLSPQPGPSKTSTSVQEESEESRPSTTNALDATSDSDNSQYLVRSRRPTNLERKKYISKNTRLSGSSMKILRTGCSQVPVEAISSTARFAIVII